MNRSWSKLIWQCMDPILWLVSYNNMHILDISENVEVNILIKRFTNHFIIVYIGYNYVK